MTDRPTERDEAAPDIITGRAFTRITGSPQIPGNAVRLLRDAAENYPAWLAAIAAAEEAIDFENYMIADDAIGRTFADALIERARGGVRVRILYDWFGSFGLASSAFWARLRAAGIEVRAFNPPALSHPLGWIRRNHRKSLTVDGRIGFVSGLCVTMAWVGDPLRNVPAWRDTGVEIRGPAVADLQRAFAASWSAAGHDLAVRDPLETGRGPAVGPIGLRVIGERPGQLSTYRLDQWVAAAARRYLWLTDAYFVATTAYVQALIAAARDGVDVRLLVPGTSDVPIAKSLSRTGYRGLLEAGIRIFEWNGPMLHAKTAVADRQWARVGSTNLNLTSWLGNWELDVTIQDEGFAAAMETMYLADLANATEIVLDARRKPRPTHGQAARPPSGSRKGGAGRLVAGAASLGSTIGAAATEARVLERSETRILAGAGLVLLVVAVLAVLVPYLIVAPLAVVLIWMAAALLLRALPSKPEQKSGRDDGAHPGRPEKGGSSTSRGNTGPYS